MDKEVKLYKQKGDTCAICCMMMVLEYYNKINKANWIDEKRLYKIYHSKYLSGVPFSAVAFHLIKNGLNVKLYHENINMFENKNNIIDNEIFELAIKEYKEYINYSKEYNLSVINGITINFNLFKNELDKNNLIILAGQISNIFHSILLVGYNENGFIVCDPLYKKIQIRTFNEIENFIDTDIGKWFITINN